MASQRFSGSTVVLAGLIGGGIGFSIALFLRSLILNTPAQVKPTTFYWWFVLLTAAGALWGIATQTMKQLERIQGYPHEPLRSRRPGDGPAMVDRPVDSQLLGSEPGEGVPDRNLMPGEDTSEP